MASIALGLTCLGCLLLALSLRRHYRQVFADDSAYESRRGLLRATGYGCLLLALWPSILASGLWIGLALWISMLALAAFLLIMLLTYGPRRSMVFGGFGVVLIALGLLF
jgi:uncharacterized protein DUF3325